MAKASDFRQSKKCMSLGTYNKLHKIYKGKKNIKTHHIIEKRFNKHFPSSITKGKMLSLPLDKKLHRKITRRWRKEIEYKPWTYDKITKKEMLAHC
jgi:hypothetical protein